MFRLDPVAVLDERDEFKESVRIAAHNVISREIEKAHKQ